jgi:hypothetical protein
MAKTSGLGDNLYVGGFNLSGDIASLGSIHGGPAALDMTSIDLSAFERQGGLRDGGIALTSYFNPASSQAHPVFSALPTTDTLLTYARGTTIGNAGACMVAKQVNYDPKRGEDGSLTFDVEAVSNAYGLEWGTQLTAGLRTDTTATSPATGVDFTAATSFGWQAYLQVTAFAGTSVTVTLQDSADNSAFAGFTGSAFTAATAIGWQRLASSSPTATVRRYVRAITTGTFSNAVFSVVFVKNAFTSVVF